MMSLIGLGPSPSGLGPSPSGLGLGPILMTNPKFKLP